MRISPTSTNAWSMPRRAGRTVGLASGPGSGGDCTVIAPQEYVTSTCVAARKAPTMVEPLSAPGTLVRNRSPCAAAPHHIVSSPGGHSGRLKEAQQVQRLQGSAQRNQAAVG